MSEQKLPVKYARERAAEASGQLWSAFSTEGNMKPDEYQVSCGLQERPHFFAISGKKTRLMSLNLRVLRNNTDAIFGNFQTLAEITCSEAAGLRLSCNITPQGHIRTQYFTQCCNVLMNMITLLHSLVWSSQLLLVQWIKHSRLPWQECLFIFRVWTQSLEQRSWKSQHNLPGWRL